MEGREEISAAAQVASEALRREDFRPFSNKGFDAYRARIAEFIGDLFDASATAARRRREDQISASDIDRAGDQLTAGARARWTRLVGPLGGVLLGGGLSQTLSMIIYNQYSAPAVAVSALLAALGGGFIVVEALRE